MKAMIPFVLACIVVGSTIYYLATRCDYGGSCRSH
jgi:hypothetical protein